MARASKPTAEDRLRWDAESLVNEAVKKTPAYRKAVNQAKTELRQAQRNVAKTIKGKK